jgi:DNA-binding CsgD family transcriptional regulator
MPGIFRVTKRQGQILSLASQGMTDKEVARHLAISPNTVRTHLDRLYRANGLRNKAEAVVAWNDYTNARGK